MALLYDTVVMHTICVPFITQNTRSTGYYRQLIINHISIKQKSFCQNSQAVNCNYHCLFKVIQNLCWAGPFCPAQQNIWCFAGHQMFWQAGFLEILTADNNNNNNDNNINTNISTSAKLHFYLSSRHGLLF